MLRSTNTSVKGDTKKAANDFQVLSAGMSETYVGAEDLERAATAWHEAKTRMAYPGSVVAATTSVSGLTVELSSSVAASKAAITSWLQAADARVLIAFMRACTAWVKYAPTVKVGTANETEEWLGKLGRINESMHTACKRMRF